MYTYTYILILVACIVYCHWLSTYKLTTNASKEDRELGPLGFFDRVGRRNTNVPTSIPTTKPSKAPTTRKPSKAPTTKKPHGPTVKKPSSKNPKNRHLGEETDYADEYELFGSFDHFFIDSGSKESRELGPLGLFDFDRSGIRGRSTDIPTNKPSRAPTTKKPHAPSAKKTSPKKPHSNSRGLKEVSDYDQNEFESIGSLTSHTVQQKQVAFPQEEEYPRVEEPNENDGKASSLTEHVLQGPFDILPIRKNKPTSAPTRKPSAGKGEKKTMSPSYNTGKGGKGGKGAYQAIQ